MRKYRRQVNRYRDGQLRALLATMRANKMLRDADFVDRARAQAMVAVAAAAVLAAGAVLLRAVFQINPS